MSIKKHSVYLRSGQSVTGKWSNRRYEIVRLLGAGAIGIVYLVRMADGRYAALKTSKDPTSMLAETNRLKSVQSVQGVNLGPALYDVDDFVHTDGKAYTFYVMEYVQGLSIRQYVKNKGVQYIGIILIHLLHELEQFHKAGFIFGDMKLDNVIVIPRPFSVRLLDIGGVTPKGKSVKEFTEFHDRGYWGMGTRVADERYDLFALVMTMIHIFYPNQFERSANNLQKIMERIDRISALRLYRTCLQNALSGKYASAKKMKEVLVPLVRKASKQTSVIKQPKKHMKQRTRQSTYAYESIGLSLLGIVYYLIGLVI